MAKPVKIVILGDATGLSRALGKADGELAAFGSRTAKVGKQLETKGAAVAAVGSKLSKGVTLPIVALAAGAGKLAVDFESKMNLLETAAGDTHANMSTISDGVLKIARQTGIGLDQLTEGSYVVDKSLSDMKGPARASKALDMLRAASQGAVAEGTDLGTMVDALSTLMKDYGDKLGTPVQATNALVRAAGLSKTNMQLFAASLSNVMPFAASVGLSFAQVGGALATMTQHGMTAQRGTENLNNTIRAMVNPNRAAQTEMQQLGVDVVDLSKNVGKRGLTGTFQILTDAIHKKFGPAGLVVLDTMRKQATASQGLQQMLAAMPPQARKLSEEYQNGSITLGDWIKAAKAMDPEGANLSRQFKTLADKAHGYNQALRQGDPVSQTAQAALAKMAGGATGLNTILMLTGGYAGSFAENTKQIGDAAKTSGKNIETWSSTQKTAKVRLSQLKESLVVAGVKLGQGLIPAINDSVHALTPFIDGVVRIATAFHDADPSTRKWIVSLGLVAAAAGPLLFIFGKITSGIGLLITAGTKIVGWAQKMGAAFSSLVAPSAAATAELAAQSAAREATLATEAAAVKVAMAEEAEATAQAHAQMAATLAASNSVMAESAAATAVASAEEAAALRATATVAEETAAEKRIAALAAAATAETASATEAGWYLLQQAAAQRAAAAVATAEAAKATAVAEAQFEIAAALEGSGSVIEASSLEAIEAQLAEAAAFEATATAATAAAAEIEAAATAAAATVEAEGEAAAVGWSAMMGPLALVGGLVAGAVGAFHLFGSSASEQVAPTDAFTDAILRDNDALGANTRKMVENSLQKKGAFDAGHKLGIGADVLTDAMMGNKTALAQVAAAQGAATLNATLALGSHKKLTKAQNDQIDANDKLSKVMGNVGKEIKVNKTAADNLTEADGKGTKSTKDKTAATAASTAATKANAKEIKGLNAQLDKLKGGKITGLDPKSKDGKAQVKTLTDLIHAAGGVTTAEAKAAAATKAHGEAVDNLGSKAAAASKKAGGSILPKIDLSNLKGVNLSGLNLGNPKVTPKVDPAAAQAQIKKLQGAINAIRQGKVPGLTADNKAGRAKIAELQGYIADLHQPGVPAINADTRDGMAKLNAMYQALAALQSKTITVTTKTAGNLQGTYNSQVPRAARAAATGGAISGPGGPVGDKIDAKLSDGEHVLTASDVKKAGGQDAIYRLRRKIQTGVLKFANGGAVKKHKGKSKSLAAATSTLTSTIGNVGQAYSTPVDVAGTGISRINAQIAAATRALDKAISKGLSKSAAASYRKQIAALRREANRQLGALKVKIKTADVSAIKAAFNGTVDDLRTALNTMLSDFAHAGGSARTMATLRKQEKTLLGLQAQRVSIANQLAKATDKLNDVQSKYNDSHDSAASAVTGTFNAVSASGSAGGDAGATYVANGTTPLTKSAGGGTGILSTLTAKVDAAKKFAANMATLAKKGVPTSILNDLAAAGPIDAAGAISELMSYDTSKIADLKTQTTALAGYADQAGKTVADANFGSSLEAAKALVNGYNPKNKDLAKRVAALAKSLGIVGVKAGGSLAKGLKGQQSTVAKAMNTLLGTMDGEIAKQFAPAKKAKPKATPKKKKPKKKTKKKAASQSAGKRAASNSKARSTDAAVRFGDIHVHKSNASAREIAAELAFKLTTSGR